MTQRSIHCLNFVMSPSDKTRKSWPDCALYSWVRVGYHCWVRPLPHTVCRWQWLF